MTALEEVNKFSFSQRKGFGTIFFVYYSYILFQNQAALNKHILDTFN